MLGSAIPRRWFLSLALVGLVTIFAASYAAVWSSPANADSQGPGVGSGNSVVLQPDQILDQIDQLPSNLTMQTDQQLSVTLNTIDSTGAPNAKLPTTTYAWSILSGSGVVFVGAVDQRTVVIQANSPGTITIQAFVDQNQETGNFVFFRDVTITVVGLIATAPAIAGPVNPGSPPVAIPNSQGVITPEGTLLVSSTGVESGGNPEVQALGSRPVVFVRSGSVTNFFGVSVSTVQPSSLPPLPSRFAPGSSAADITFRNAAGTAQSNFRLLRSAQICLPTTSDDRANGISNIRLLRNNEAIGQWVELTSTYNNITRQVCAHSSNFSTFAVAVLQLEATPASDVKLPATGGWSPDSGLLLLAGLLGFALVGGGAVSIRRARNARSD